MAKNYVSNKELHCELVVSKEMGRLTKKAEISFISICKGVNKKFYYNNPQDREDTLQEAMLSVFKNWYNYDPNKTTNAFAFFTEISKRAHAQGWNQLNKNREDYSINAFWEQDGDWNV